MICASQAVRGYPTMKLYRNGNEIETSSVSRQRYYQHYFFAATIRHPTRFRLLQI